MIKAIARRGVSVAMGVGLVVAGAVLGLGSIALGAWRDVQARKAGEQAGAGAIEGAMKKVNDKLRGLANGLGVSKLGGKR